MGTIRIGVRGTFPTTQTMTLICGKNYVDPEFAFAISTFLVAQNSKKFGPLVWPPHGGCRHNLGFGKMPNSSKHPSSQPKPIQGNHWFDKPKIQKHSFDQPTSQLEIPTPSVAIHSFTTSPVSQHKNLQISLTNNRFLTLGHTNQFHHQKFHNPKFHDQNI